MPKGIRDRWRTSVAALKERSPLFTKHGPVPGKDAPSAEASISEKASPSISDTPVTGTGPSVISDPNPWSTTFANDTPTLSIKPTVWTMSLYGYVGQGSQKITDADLAWLKPSHQKDLKDLAWGRGEGVEDTIRAIANYFAEEESYFLEFPLDEAVAWYLDNLVLH